MRALGALQRPGYIAGPGLCPAPGHCAQVLAGEGAATMLRSGCGRLRGCFYYLHRAVRAPAKSGRRSLVSCIDRKTHSSGAGVRSLGGEGVPWSERPQSACHPRLALAVTRATTPRLTCRFPNGLSPPAGLPILFTGLAFLTALTLCGLHLWRPWAWSATLSPTPKLVGGKPGVGNTCCRRSSGFLTLSSLLPTSQGPSEDQ